MTIHTLRSSALVAALFLGAAALPSSLRAQAAVADRGITAVSAPTAGSPAPAAVADLVAGPRVAPAGINTHATSAPLALAPKDNVGVGSNLALMGVGAAAVVVGLMIGGDGGTIIALGGGVLGLIGLYRYLR